MQVGCLGSIAFQVSDKVIKTLRAVSWSGSASIATHSVHLDNSLQEFVGVEPDSIDFKMQVSKFLGADPMTDIETLFSYERSGTPVSLTIGTKSYGKYKWLIKKHKVAMEYHDKQGNLIQADITVSLTEYTKG